MSHGKSLQELSFGDYLTILRRRWAWALVPFVLAVAASVVLTARQTPSYEATARVLVADNEAQRALDPTASSLSLLRRELGNEVSLATSDAAHERMEDEFGDAPMVEISTNATSDVLEFHTTAGDPEQAAEQADAWAATYVDLKQKQSAESLDSALSNLRQRLTSLEEDRQTARAPLDELARQIAAATTPELASQLQSRYDRRNDELSYRLGLIEGQAVETAASVASLEQRAELSAMGTARVIQAAVPPINPTNAPLWRNVALGTVLGLIAGLGLAIARESADHSLRTEADVRRISSVPVLATIPAPQRRLRKIELALASRVDPHGRDADAYQKVRSALQFASVGGEVVSVLVTSANSSEGKTTTSSNLAWALSSVGKRTLLVDVDFRRPRIHEVYGIPSTKGLTDNILDGTSFADLVLTADHESSNLLVLPVGRLPPNPAAFVGTQPFLNAIQWLEREADAVVLDAPPVLPVSDALTIGSHADAVVLTAMARKTTSSDVEAALNSLEGVGANVIGVVLLGVRSSDGYSRAEYGSTAPADSTVLDYRSLVSSPRSRLRWAVWRRQRASPEQISASSGTPLE